MDLIKDFRDLILVISFPILLFSYLVNLLTNMMCNEVEHEAELYRRSSVLNKNKRRF